VSATTLGGLTIGEYGDNEGIALARDGKSVYVSEEDKPAVASIC